MKKVALNIYSEKFGQGGLIPAKYTCDGKNINPPLEIENLPPQTKSLVVVLEDKTWEGNEAVKWLAYNIPAKSWIDEDERKGELGINRHNQQCYSGPCPEKGLHHYLFKVYAMDDYLYFSQPHVSRCDVEDGIRYHLLGYGELEGVYDREAKLELMRLPLDQEADN